MLQRIRDWGAGLEHWQKFLGAIVGIIVALYVMSGCIDSGFAWYLQRSALAGEIRDLKQQNTEINRKVDNISRLSLQKQDIDLSKEIHYYERIERQGRLSPGEESYLHILRQQRDQVKRELRTLPPVTR